MSLTALKNSPPAPTTFFTTIVAPSSSAPDQNVFTNPVSLTPAAAVSQLDHFSPFNEPTAIMPSSVSKVFKAARKSKSITQLFLMDDSSQAGYQTTTSPEATGLAMPPPVP
jgi:hypothetical protein